MTTRPGDAALGLWTTGRTKRVTNLVRIMRADQVVQTFTDHDRALTFEGELYVPGQFTAMSSETREAALRTSDQQLNGLIDGDTIAIPDLVGNRYRGARVDHVVTDWSMPWLAIRRNTRWIRAVRWDEFRWVGILEGVQQILERPTGGRFGGVQTRTCPYVLGSTHCGANIATAFRRGVKVATVSDDRLTFTLEAASFSGTFADDYYRDGEIAWRWAPSTFAASGVNAGATSLTVSPSPGWTVDEHVGSDILILDAVDGGVTAYATITANTVDTLTYTTLSGAPYTSKDVEICPLSQLTFNVSPIVRHVHATKTIELLYATPFPVTVGMRGNLRPGCDGLFSTCKSKFANQDRFGGAHLAPQPNELLEVAR